MEELTEAQVIEMLQQVAVWSDQQHDSIDYDTVEGQRLRIAGMSIHKALDALIGKRDVIIRKDMERSRANTDAHWELGKLLGNTTMVYLPERDYVRELAEARANVEDVERWRKIIDETGQRD